MFPPQDWPSRGQETPPYSDESPAYIELEEDKKEKQTTPDDLESRLDSGDERSLHSIDELSLHSIDETSLDSVDESCKLTNPHESVSGGRFSKFSGSAKRALGFLGLLLPSFLRRTSDPSKKLHSTAWLDGLRGIAAFCVVCHHSVLVVFSWDIHRGWYPGSNQPWLVQFIKLPIIRLIIAGKPQVALFFVVSGYAISYKPLQQARQGDFKGVGLTLFSSVFRRHTRLFMPATFVTLFSALSVQVDRNWYGSPSDGLPGVAVPTRVPFIADSLMGQLNHWGISEVVFTSPLNNGIAQDGDPHTLGSPYDGNLWTLPVEFSSSLVVFGFLMAFAMIHNRIRMVAAIAVASYLEWYFIFWTVFLFMCGMFICDLHFEIDEIMAKASRTSTDAGGEAGDRFVLPIWARAGRQGVWSKITDRLTYLRGAKRLAGRLAGVLAFWLSLHILSTPPAAGGARFSFGYVTLLSWVPERLHDNLLVPLGAVATVLVLDRATFLQVLFTNRVSQYLGRISFSLYMIHGPLLWSMGLKFAHYFLGLTGGATDGAYGLAVFMAACVWWIITIYLADLTTTFIDKPCVRLSRWAYAKISKADSGR